MIDVSVLKAMAAKGATVEMIIAAVEAAQQVETEKVCARRERDRIRKRNQRACPQESVGQGGTSRNPRDTPSPAPSLDKENPPDPLKKLNPSPPPSHVRDGEEPSLSQSDFDTFWETYPRKIAKGAARKAFKGALKKASFAELLSGLQRYAAGCATTEAQFIAHPSTWLNQERWLDVEAPEVRPHRRLTASEQRRAETDEMFDTLEAKLASQRMPDDGSRPALLANDAPDFGDVSEPGGQASGGLRGGSNSPAWRVPAKDARGVT